MDTSNVPAPPGEIRAFVADLGVVSRAKGGDGRTIFGVAVPWDRAIDVYGDGYLIEEFRRGAADHQMSGSAVSRIKLSDRHMYRGGEVIGVTKVLRNLTEGLYFEARASAIPAGDRVLTLAEDRALDQVSVGFRERADGNQYKTIEGVEQKNWVIRTKVDLFEIAVVAEGAYGDGATITGLRDGQGRSRPYVADDRERNLRDYLAGLNYTSEEIERAWSALQVPQVDRDADLLAQLAALPPAASL